MASSSTFRTLWSRNPDGGPFWPRRGSCSRLARTHYENFTVASLLLPRRLLRHFHAVYAYCRWADDLADEVGGGPRGLRILRWWREELLRCYDDRPRHPVMIALRETIEKFRIPPDPFLNLLFALEQDQIVKRYATFEQLLAYCQNSANPVGHLILYLGEAFNRENAILSDHICTALQLTNFWQDVDRDFAIGRVYVPGEDRQRFGYREADLQNRRYTPDFAELMRFQVERTRDRFYRGVPLVERLAPDIRPDVELFIRGGLAVLRKISAGIQCVGSTAGAGEMGKSRVAGGDVDTALEHNLLVSPTRRQREAPCLTGAALGPNGEIPSMSCGLAASYAYCERLARREAANFYPAFRILPGRQRRAMCALYAFLRVADDLSDGPGTGAEKQAAFAAWRRGFQQSMAGDHSHPLHAALHDTVRVHGIPCEYLHAVLDGVEMDLFQDSYASFADLYRYCYRVASAVGLACIHIWGFADQRANAYAESAGIAFQLTNILRDLREDANRGPGVSTLRKIYARLATACSSSPAASVMINFGI